MVYREDSSTQASRLSSRSQPVCGRFALPVCHQVHDLVRTRRRSLSQPNVRRPHNTQNQGRVLCTSAAAARMAAAGMVARKAVNEPCTSATWCDVESAR